MKFINDVNFWRSAGFLQKILIAKFLKIFKQGSCPNQNIFGPDIIPTNLLEKILFVSKKYISGRI
jgi:hypothetical protein